MSLPDRERSEAPVSLPDRERSEAPRVSADRSEHYPFGMITLSMT